MTIIKSNDGGLIVGGNDKKLTKLGSDLSFISSLDLGDIVYCGIAINQRLFACGMNFSLRVFENSLNQVIEKPLTNCPKKLLLYEDLEFLLCGEMGGNVDIVSLLTWEIVYTIKLNPEDVVNDITKLTAENQYALCLGNGGVQTVEIKRNNKGF